jgi:hypothetical protein
MIILFYIVVALSLIFTGFMLMDWAVFALEKIWNWMRL